MATQVHHFLAAGEVEHFYSAVLFAGDGGQEVVAYEFQPETTELLRIQFVDELPGDFADFAVTVEFIEIFVLFGFFLIGYNLLTHKFIQVPAVLLFLLKEVSGVLAVLADEAILGPLGVVELDL